jgi:glycosyltransferase involved in cell wall biosynthesis
MTVLLANPAVIDTAAPPAEVTPELVLFAGEIGRRKGADVLAAPWPDVARARPHARCIMIGPRTAMPVDPQPRLEVRPPAGAEAIVSLIRQARVIALPSRAEAMPMILVEAQAAGRPFTSTPVGAIPQLAACGGGVLVPVGHAAELARQLIALLADPGLAGRLRVRGRADCAAARGVDHIDAQWARLYVRSLSEMAVASTTSARGRSRRRRTSVRGKLPAR